MKNVIDTNPIITACISEDYKERIKKYLQDQNSLTVLTIYNEIQDKLLLLLTSFIGLERFSTKKGKNKSLLLNLPLFKDLKNTSEEVYKFIEDYDGNIASLASKIQISIGVLLSNLRKLRVYPNDDRKKQDIINLQKTNLFNKLPRIKENDLNHLYLMHQYTQEFASIINFYTEDKKDYLNNKEAIENVLEDIKIKKFLEYI